MFTRKYSAAIPYSGRATPFLFTSAFAFWIVELFWNFDMIKYLLILLALLKIIECCTNCSVWEGGSRTVWKTFTCRKHDTLWTSRHNESSLAGGAIAIALDIHKLSRGFSTRTPSQSTSYASEINENDYFHIFLKRPWNDFSH